MKVLLCVERRCDFELRGAVSSCALRAQQAVYPESYPRLHFLRRKPQRNLPRHGVHCGMLCLLGELKGPCYGFGSPIFPSCLLPRSRKDSLNAYSLNTKPLNSRHWRSFSRGARETAPGSSEPAERYRRAEEASSSQQRDRKPFQGESGVWLHGLMSGVSGFGVGAVTR